MNTLIQKQDSLHKEATILLETILLPILQEYGNTSVGGSYLYKLLNYPDLDIDVVSDKATKEKFAELSAKLIALSNTSKFKSSDRVNYPHTNSGKRPVGYWISPEINFGENVWKIDIWLQKSDWYTGDTNRYEAELLNASEEKRIAVLSLKEELIEKGLYGIGKEFLSVDVYEGVLQGNTKTVDELRKFLSTANH